MPAVHRDTMQQADLQMQQADLHLQRAVQQDEARVQRHRTASQRNYERHKEAIKARRAERYATDAAFREERRRYALQRYYARRAPRVQNTLLQYDRLVQHMATGDVTA